MGDRPDPYEHTVATLRTIRRGALHLAMQDNELCPRDRAHLELIDAATEHAKLVCARKRLTDYLVKGGDPATDYGKRLAREARLNVTHLDDARSRRALITFPGVETNDIG